MTKKGGIEDKSDPNCTTCTDFKDWFSQQKQQKQTTSTDRSSQQHQQKQNNNSQDNQQQTKKPPLSTPPPPQQSQTTTPTSATSNPEYYDECPMFRDQFGRAAWSYLHTMAANYPEKPNEVQKTKMSDFINTFAMFFPCKHCAEDFREE